MLKTRITDLFGIEHPVIQGGMQWVGYAELVSAVSNAGALGILTALTQPSPEDLAKEIERTRGMTDKPFGVNLTVLPTINPPPYEEYAQAIVGSGVKIVETAGRSPEPFMELFKEYDVKVIHKCTSVRHALKAQSVGVSAITIDGFECAGHPGEDDIPSLVLLPQAAEALDVPVAGCGGFSDAKSMVAALALGGEAIVMGTRFMATKEAGIHQNVKDKMTEADELSTNLMFRTMHNTARVFKNSVSDQVVDIESSGTASFEDVKDLVAGQRGRVVFEEGDLEHGIWSAGISVARVKDVPTCKEMVSRFCLLYTSPSPRDRSLSRMPSSA